MPRSRPRPRPHSYRTENPCSYRNEQETKNIKVWTKDIVILWQNARPEQYHPLFFEGTQNQIVERTKVNHDIRNFEETRHGYMHKTFIRNLDFDAARVIFYLLHKHGIAVYNIAGKVERAFQFFSEEEAQELLLQEGYDEENYWEEIYFPSDPLRIM